jgi:hypothetical protein
MDDQDIQGQIEALVAEEHQLFEAKPDPTEDAERHKRLEAVRHELDRCWDLLRQRRGREEFDLDPDVVSARDAETVEGYQQ